MYPINIQACGRFINSNAITKMANSSSKSPELLAKYCDSLLKKSSKNPEEAELEDTLNQVVSHRNNLIYLPPTSPLQERKKRQKKVRWGGDVTLEQNLQCYISHKVPSIPAKLWNVAIYFPSLVKKFWSLSKKFLFASSAVSSFTTSSCV